MSPTTGPVTLGERYRDSFTGFEGVATSRTEFLYGCVRVCLEADTLKDDGTPKDAVFDEQRLMTGAGDKPAPTAKSGGPRSVPGAPSIATRPRGAL